MLFYKTAFQCERLELAVGNNNIKGESIFHHFCYLCIVHGTRFKILTYTVCQPFCLADVDNFILFIADYIYPRQLWQTFCFAKKLLLSRNARFRMIKKSSRDNARTPMQWSGEEGAGFTSGDPWLKINKNHTWINVEWEDARDDGILDFWKKMWYDILAEKMRC